ncbi:MAG: M17 family peptidase N-terminal domain-containing protein, partial [Woeseiaceae bacterium]
MEYFTTTSNASRRVVDCVIVGVYERNKLSAGADEINTASGGEIRKRIKSGDVSATVGRCTILTNVPGVGANRVAVVGLGKLSKLDATTFRKALTAAFQSISQTKAKSVLNCLTLEAVDGGSPYYLARHTAEAANYVLYRFTQMKTGRKPAGSPLRKIGLAVAKRGDAAASMRGAEHGEGIAAGVALAKDLGNL